MGSSLPCGGSATAPPPPPRVPVRHLVRLPHFFPPATKAHTAAITSIGRRSSFLFPYLLFFSFSSSSPAATSLLALEYFTDQDKGYSVLRPSSWMQVEKAGATALFEEGKGRNNIGVVVSPVRLSSLKEFGTPEFVADKLIQAERKKLHKPFLHATNAPQKRRILGQIGSCQPTFRRDIIDCIDLRSYATHGFKEPKGG